MSVFVLLKHKDSSGDPVEIEVIGADSAEITTGFLNVYSPECEDYGDVIITRKLVGSFFMSEIIGYYIA